MSAGHHYAWPADVHVSLEVAGSVCAPYSSEAVRALDTHMRIWDRMTLLIAYADENRGLASSVDGHPGFN
jgi:hypothetical protein